MAVLKLRAGVLLIGGFALATPFLRAETLGAAEIVKKSVEVNSSDWKAQPAYSYRERDTKSKIDTSGHAKAELSKTYEVTMIEGTPYNRLVAIENEPLRQEQQQQEQMKLNRAIQRRQNESASERQARILKYQNERSEEHLLMQQMVNAFNFNLHGEQQVGGVACYVLDATPNPEYDPPLEKAKVLTGMRGRLWIDKARFHWVKVEAEVTQPVQIGLFIAKVKPGTKFELDQAQVGTVWLPKRFTQSINASVLGIYGMRNRDEDDYSDYRQIMLNANIRAIAK